MNSTRPKLDRIPPHLLSLVDYAAFARDFIDPAAWEWLEGGSGSLDARDDNIEAFRRRSIYNRVLVDCRHGSTRTSVLGLDLAFPIGLAPIGYHRLFHDRGEVATIEGAFNTLTVVGNFASVPLAEIARSARGALWFQLYFQPEREQTLQLVRLAEQCGFKAIAVTLDAPVKPQSLGAQKAGFSMPAHIDAVNVRGFVPASPRRLSASDSDVFQGLMPFAPQWDDIRWLREATRLPLLAKGIGHPDDAKALVAAGFDGIIVSNHGGRALVAAPAALDAVGPVRAAVGPDVPVLMDGGVRSGADVFKAVASGANAVLVGRPQMHALAVAGALGVAHMLKLLREELELVMALAGCPTIADITAKALIHRA